MNIDNFKVINEQYGEKKGDEVLQYTANLLQNCMEQLDGICCRHSSDKFATLFPADALNSAGELINKCHESIKHPPFLKHPLQIRIGRCLVKDPSQTIEAIYNSAILAEESIRGRYDVYIADYQDELRQNLLYEQRIVSEMYDALNNGQFETWFQPQFNHETGTLIGTEALVRWRHPQDGLLIPPGKFISIFEKNGFIYELDKYVWEQVCQYLRKWLDQGLDPLPVSVNVSRQDIIKPDLIDVLVDLLKKYDLPVYLFRLKITESAFPSSPHSILKQVHQLIDHGFTVEIDDFGSGYSSLNTLKDIPAHIIKLDMKFLENTTDNQRSGIILASVVRMLNWLNVSIIAEGVETREQADLLKSIGCQYVQGYLYAQPMPAEAYEKILKSKGHEQFMKALKTVNHLSSDAFWDPKSLDALIFNSYIGGACIVEKQEDRLEVLRANDKYMQEVGNAKMTISTVLRINWAAYMDTDSRNRFYKAINDSIATGKEYDGTYLFLHLPGASAETWLHITLRIIATNGSRALLYCMVSNITALWNAQNKEKEMEAQLQAIFQSVNGGIIASTFQGGKGTLVFANEAYYAILGYTREQYHAEVPNGLLDLVIPEDLPILNNALENTAIGAAPRAIEYRVRKRDGSQIWVFSKGTACRLEGIDLPVHIVFIVDLSERKNVQAQFRFLNDLAHDILSQADISVGMGHMLEKLLNFFQADRVLILEYQDKSQSANVSFELCAKGIPSRKASWQEIPYYVFPTLKNVLEKESFVYVPSVTQLPEESQERQTMHAYGITSLAAISLHQDGVVSGLIGLENPRKGTAYIERLIALGDYVSVMLSRRDHAALLEARMQEQIQLIQDMPGGYAKILYVDGRLVPLFLNDQLYEFFGLTPEDFSHKYAWDASALIHPDDLPLVHRALQDALKKNIPSKLNTRLFKGNKAFVPMQIFFRIGTDSDGKTLVNCYYSPPSLQDLVVKQSQELLDYLPVGAVLLSYDKGLLKVLHVNKRYRELVQRTPVNYQGTSFLRVLHPDDRRPFLTSLTEAITAGNREYNKKIRLLYGPDGDYASFYITASLVPQPDGNVWIHATHKSVSEVLFDLPPEGRAILSIPQTFSYIQDARLRYVAANTEAARFLGLSPEELLVKHDLSEPAFPLPKSESSAALLQNGEAVLDAQIHADEKGETCMSHTKFPIRDQQGKIIGILGIGRDITNYYNYAREFDTLLQLLPTGILKIQGNDPFQLVYISQYLAEVLGYAHPKFDTQFQNSFLNLVYTEDQEKARAVLLSTDPASHHSVQLRMNTKSMGIHWFSCRCVRFTDSQGRNWFYMTAADITDIRKNEARLRLLTDGISGGLGTFSYEKGKLKVIYLNTGFYTSMGYTPGEFHQMPASSYLSFIYEEDRTPLWIAFHALLMDQTPTQSAVFRRQEKDGKIRWFSLNAGIAKIRGDEVIFNVAIYDITEQKDVEQRLRTSEEEYRLATLQSNVVIGRYAIAENTLTISSKTASTYGIPEIIHNIPHIWIEKGLISPDTTKAYLAFYEKIHKGEKEGKVRYKRLHDGQFWIWREIQFTTLFSQEGHPLSAIITSREITEQMEQEAIYKKWAQSLEERPKDSYTFVRCNISRNTSVESMEGSLLNINYTIPDQANYTERLQEYVRAHVLSEDQDALLSALSPVQLLKDQLDEKHNKVIEYRKILPDGSHRWLQLTIELVEYPGSRDIMAYMLYENIDDRKKEELKTQRQAGTDVLTGLLNRATFKEKLTDQINKRPQNAIDAHIILDMDGFKQVNDTFGHMTGDQVLVEISRDLQSFLSKDDLLCRLGGDEFMLFMSHLSSSSALEEKAKQLQKLLHKTIGHDIVMTVSIGIALIPNDGLDFESLYAKADAALYHVKAIGKNGYHFYTEI